MKPEEFIETIVSDITKLELKVLTFRLEVEDNKTLMLINTRLLEFKHIIEVYANTIEK